MATLHLFGSPRVRTDAGKDLALAPREAALLAWLHFEGSTPRSRLAALLWPQGSEAQARANLRQTLVRLKRTAGALWCEDDAGLMLLAEVAPANRQMLLGSLHFDDADALSQWLEDRRAALHREQQRELMARLQGLLAAGALDEASLASNQLLATDPESEEAWRLRMQLFYLRDDRAAALAAWDECRHALRRAFGAAPSEATNALGRLILAGQIAPTPGASATALPIALRRPPRLVGRDSVLRDVEHCLALGHAVVLAGEGGIGKTRLLQELAARQTASLAVSARPGDSLSSGVLLGRLLAGAMARWTPDLDSATRRDLEFLMPGRAVSAGLQSAQDHHRIHAAAARALLACHLCGLHIVLIDDLQFADDASVRALQVMLGRWAKASPGEVPVPVIGVRPDELSTGALALLDQLADSGRAARFDLPPLGQSDLVALLQSMPLPEPSADAASHETLAAALVARVGGNPAHVVESLKSLWLDGMENWADGRAIPVPPTLVEAVRRRLQRLGEEPLQLAQLAAVAGADFSLALAASALGRPPLALAPLLTRLEAAQVFNGQGFVHDLVAEAVAASIPSALAGPLRVLIAEFLAARPDHDEAAARIAQHLQAAGDTAGAAHWHLSAARQARSRWQLQDAALAFEAAARSLDPSDRAAVGAAWHEAARCWILASRNAEAQSALSAAERMASSDVDRARLLPARTAWLFNSQRWAEAVSCAGALIDAVARYGEFFEPRDLAQGMRSVGITVAYGTDIDRALAMADQAQALIGGRDADAIRLLRTARGGLLHWASRPLEALADLQAAWPDAAARNEIGTRIALANQLMRVRHSLGDLPAALDQGRVLLAQAESIELGVATVTDVMHVLAMMEIGSGQAVAGMARWVAVQQRLDAAGQPLPDLYLTSQALANMAVGRHHDAAAWLARHPPPGRAGLAIQDLNWQLARARLAHLQDEDPSCWLAEAAGVDGLPPGLQLQRQLATALIQPPAYDTMPPLLALLRERGLLSQLRSGEIAAARAAILAGLQDAACAHARQALLLAPHVECWIDEAASVWLASAEVLHQCGQIAEAQAAAAAGARWVQQGAEQWIDPCQRDCWLHFNPQHRRLLAWI